MDGVGKATMALARQLAPHVRKQGEKLLPASVAKKSGDGKSKIDDVMEVAAGGLQGLCFVYRCLTGLCVCGHLSSSEGHARKISSKFARAECNLRRNSLLL